MWSRNSSSSYPSSSELASISEVSDVPQQGSGHRAEWASETRPATAPALCSDESATLLRALLALQQPSQTQPLEPMVPPPTADPITELLAYWMDNLSSADQPDAVAYALSRLLAQESPSGSSSPADTSIIPCVTTPLTSSVESSAAGTCSLLNQQGIGFENGPSGGTITPLIDGIVYDDACWFSSGCLDAGFRGFSGASTTASAARERSCSTAADSLEGDWPSQYSNASGASSSASDRFPSQLALQQQQQQQQQKQLAPQPTVTAASPTTTVDSGLLDRSCCGSGKLALAALAALRQSPSISLKATHATRRWHNLNVVLPLVIERGTVAVLRGENTYVFPDSEPGAQLLFSAAGPVSNVWASALRLRIAVIHKCPEFAVSAVASLFSRAMGALLAAGARPLRLQCGGLVRHKIQLRSAGTVTFRYDTICQLVSQEDVKMLNDILGALDELRAVVNGPLYKQVESVMRREGRRCGLEFRFSPCKDLKVAIREGAQCTHPSVDVNISGGGSASLSEWSKRFTTTGLVAPELRLEPDKSPVLVQDPLFDGCSPDTLPSDSNFVRCREICCDQAGKPARALLISPSEFHATIAPKVVPMAQVNASAAAQSLLGATGHPLNAMINETVEDRDSGSHLQLLSSSSAESLTGNNIMNTARHHQVYHQQSRHSPPSHHLRQQQQQLGLPPQQVLQQVHHLQQVQKQLAAMNAVAAALPTAHATKPSVLHLSSNKTLLVNNFSAGSGGGKQQ